MCQPATFPAKVGGSKITFARLFRSASDILRPRPQTSECEVRKVILPLIGLDRTVATTSFPFRRRAARIKSASCKRPKTFGIPCRNFPAFAAVRSPHSSWRRASSLFELILQGDELKVAEERHCRLVPANELNQGAIRAYRAD